MWIQGSNRSNPCHHCVTTNSTVDRPRHTPRREGRPTQVDSPRTRPEASRHHRRKGAEPTGEVPQSEGVRHEPAAGRGGPARQDAVVSDGHAGRTPPLPARTPDPCFRSEERAAGSTANACSPSTGRIHRSLGMRRSPATVGPGVRRAGRSPCARGRRVHHTHRCRRSVHRRTCGDEPHVYKVGPPGICRSDRARRRRAGHPSNGAVAEMVKEGAAEPRVRDSRR